ncbi:glycosyltransferase family 4 protein [Alloiococcus sp. CFN-8]|uniref:glycosyltransferase family 4 protein n=1 Tax=Alloiococcus sp. CFN-8 TaxID=3416081 RepID=UPI003CF75919
MANVLILANNDTGLYKFRRELIEELLSQGNSIYISLPNGDFVQSLIDMGCIYIDTCIDRRGINPITDLMLLKKYFKIIKSIKPDIVITYTIKPNVYGGIVCRITKTPYIANITGLGTAIENHGILQKLTLFLYKLGIKKANCVFFQNKDNLKRFKDNGIVGDNIRQVPGSGVNLIQHRFEEYPPDNKIHKFLFIGRIMRDKGINELLESAKTIKYRYSNVQFDLVGGIEEEYKEILSNYENNGVIIYHGKQNDVHSFIKESNATILPSYHEGVSNALLESASSGRPILASRVAGCLETFDEEITGLGFEVKNSDSLTETIIKFINLPYDKKKLMGINGRKKMEIEFDRRIVIEAYIEEIYKALT